MDPSREELLQRLHYDPESGSFTRLVAGSARHCGLVGKKAGATNKHTGYVEIHVCGSKHYGHRLAWIAMHGAIPEGMRIDHANRIRNDNRACNIRLATHADNMRNSKVRTDNRSGVKGVYFDSARGLWAAEVSGRKLGRFPTLEAAAAARVEAARQDYGAFAVQ